MTMAKGRWESEPMPWEVAAGRRPRVATIMVIMNGAEAEDGAFERGFGGGETGGAHLVDALKHDDAGLDRDAEQREEADAGRDGKVIAGEVQERDAVRRRGAIATLASTRMRPLEGAEHAVQNHEDDQDGDGADDGMRRREERFWLSYSPAQSRRYPGGSETCLSDLVDCLF